MCTCCSSVWAPTETWTRLLFVEYRPSSCQKQCQINSWLPYLDWNKIEKNKDDKRPRCWCLFSFSFRSFQSTISCFYLVDMKKINGTEIESNILFRNVWRPLCLQPCYPRQTSFSSHLHPVQRCHGDRQPSKQPALLYMNILLICTSRPPNYKCSNLLLRMIRSN